LRICADENVAPKLTELLRQQLLSPANTLETVDDHQARGVEDEVWVRKFAKAGGEAIVGGDFKLTQRPHEIVAIMEQGLRVIVLDQKWPRAPKHVQISYLFYWWPEIERVLSTAKAGTCHKVPWGWPEKTEGAIKPIKVDLQEAYKKIRKASKNG
jgi:hypothetical protein